MPTLTNCSVLLLGLLVKDADHFSTDRIQTNLFLEGRAEQNNQLSFCKYLVYSTDVFNFEIAVSYLSSGHGSLPYWSKKASDEQCHTQLNNYFFVCFVNGGNHKTAS